MNGPMSSLIELLAEVIVPLEEAEEQRALEAALTPLGGQTRIGL